MWLHIYMCNGAKFSFKKVKKYYVYVHSLKNFIIEMFNAHRPPEKILVVNVFLYMEKYNIDV